MANTTTKITMLGSAMLALVACGKQTAPTVAPEAAVPAPVAQAAEAPAAPKIDAEAEAQWQAFLKARGDYLESLAGPLVDCTDPANDSETDPFAPCSSSDWRTRLQSAHALTKLANLTRDPRYAHRAEESLSGAVLDSVERALDEDGVAIDPYAFTWLLAVASQGEIQDGTRVTQLADRVAGGLEQWLAERPDHEMVRGVMLGSSNSVAWIVQNMYQWAKARGDQALAQRMQKFTETELATEDYDEWCSLVVDERPDSYELFPPCLHRVLAVLTVMPQDKSGPWLDRFLPERVSIEPVEQAAWSTHAALNFSRSWGLWALYQATGESRWRDLYVDHVTTQMEEAQWSNVDEYDRPWIAQFGVYAIGMSYALDSSQIEAAGGAAAAPR